jgi:nitrous oxidase accessory protein NosD
MSSKWLVSLLLAILIVPAAHAAVPRTCARTIDSSRITQSTTLCGVNYDTNGIIIAADNVVLDCGSGVLKGKFKTTGITIDGRRGVTIKNCQVAHHEVGILVKNSASITILDSNLLRNNIGVKLLDSTSVTVENTFDISIKKPVQPINSVGNAFQFTNKKLQGDICRLNQCNTASGLAEHAKTATKSDIPQRALARVLRDNFRAWLTI